MINNLELDKFIPAVNSQVEKAFQESENDCFWLVEWGVCKILVQRGEV